MIYFTIVKQIQNIIYIILGVLMKLHGTKGKGSFAHPFNINLT